MTVIGEYEEKAFSDDFPLDFGNGSRGSFILVVGKGTIGILEAHITPNGDLCCGAVYWDSPHEAYTGPIWTNTGYDVITLNPSIKCNDCGHHGHLKESRWVPEADSTC